MEGDVLSPSPALPNPHAGSTTNRPLPYVVPLGQLPLFKLSPVRILQRINLGLVRSLFSYCTYAVVEIFFADVTTADLEKTKSDSSLYTVPVMVKSPPFSTNFDVSMLAMPIWPSAQNRKKPVDVIIVPGIGAAPESAGTARIAVMPKSTIVSRRRRTWFPYQ